MSNHTVVADSNFSRIGSDELKDYAVYALCKAGCCTFIYNTVQFEIKANDLLVIREQQLMQHIKADAAFEVLVLYIHFPFVEKSTPDVNFDVRSELLLTANPALQLNPKEFERVTDDIHVIIERGNDHEHHFQKDVLSACCLLFLLDIFDVQNRIYGSSHVSVRSSHLVTAFMEMLKSGEYKQHREVSYYADKLFVTSKHLSAVCRMVTGRTANYWINHFVKLAIHQQLRSERLSVVEVSEMFNFSSPAHFSRYVQAQLGEPPTAIREK